MSPAPPPSPASPDGPDSVYRTLFAAYPDALLVVDLQGRIVLANPAAAMLLGYAVDELPRLRVDDLVPDAIRPQHAAYREAYGRNPRPRPMGMQMDLSAKRRDGSEVQVEISLSPLRDHGLPLVVAAIRDIGDYPRVRQALQRARYAEHLAQIGRLAVDTREPQAMLDDVTRVAAEALHVDMAVLYLLESNATEVRVAGGVGLLAEEARGTRVPHRPDSSLGFVLTHGRSVIVPDYPAERRFVVPRAFIEAGLKSGLTVPLSDRGRIVGALSVGTREPRRFDDDAVRFLESLANLLATSLQRAASEEALNHAQRLESVGQLTGGIAHDFNNLLTVIQGNLQVLEELPAIAANGPAQQYLAAARRAARRGAELTTKLLAFSRRQLLQPAAVDVEALLHPLADMLRRTLDERIRISVEIGEPALSVRADPGQLESALLNIAINARDAMPEGGTLSFRAGACRALPDLARQHLDDPSASEEGFVAIAIADSGTGMSEEVRERAFEPFFTTKEAGRGTGLGLSTVYGFVRQSKGAIAIDSALGAGTTVTLYIPRPWDTTPAAEHLDAGEAPPPGLRVLLVEDDAEVRKVVRTYLDGLGCVTTAVATAEQALEVLRQQPAFDLLLSDIALGAGMRGTQLAAEVQLRLPDVAVLLMSGYSSELLEADRDSPPSWELLRKPYGRAELGRAIARVIAARRAES